MRLYLSAILLINSSEGIAKSRLSARYAVSVLSLAKPSHNENYCHPKFPLDVLA